MCRIFGYLSEKNISHSLAVYQTVSDAMASGGPDNQNFVVGDFWAIGTNRLAVQDSSDDSPVAYQYHSKIVVAYNGEIYNHRALRQILASHEIILHGENDGNVIAPLYELYGPSFIKLLDGMFAIAIVDLRGVPALYLFSDPTGIKSLYYSWDDNERILTFSSELCALFPLISCPLEINPTKVYDFLSMRAVCGEQTIFRNVKTLSPSSLAIYEVGKLPSLKSYDTDIKGHKLNCNIALNTATLKKILSNDIEAMLKTDVPVCTVLSGGLDSTLISAIASTFNPQISSFHVCYKGSWPHDERKFATEAAMFLGIKLNVIEIDPDDLPDLILKTNRHIGQPNSAPHNISTYCLFEGVSQAGFKVCLTGEGSDELFAGYARFSAALTDEENWVPTYMDKFGAFSNTLLKSVLTPHFVSQINFEKSLYQRWSKMLACTQHGEERLNSMQYIDQLERFPYYILKRVDHLSMAHGVEVRVPFCQAKVAEFAKKLSVDQRLYKGEFKRIVYEVADGLVPKSILQRPKQPFTLPITQMICRKSKLLDFMMSIFLDTAFSEHGYFDRNKVLKYCEDHLNKPDNDIANMLWAIMTYEVWHKSLNK